MLILAVTLNLTLVNLRMKHHVWVSFCCFYERTDIQLYELCIIFVFIFVVILNLQYAFYELCTVFVFIWDKILKVLVYNLYVVHIIF